MGNGIVFKVPITLEELTATGTVPAGETQLFFDDGDLFLRNGTTNSPISQTTSEFNNILVGSNYVGVETPPTDGALIEGRLGVGGVLSPHSDLHIDGSFAVATREVTNANYTVADGDAAIFVTTGNTNRTITMPPAANITGRQIWVVKVDSGSGDVIIDPNGSETINDSSSYSLTAQYQSVRITSLGSNIRILGSHGI